MAQSINEPDSEPKYRGYTAASLASLSVAELEELFSELSEQELQKVPAAVLKNLKAEQLLVLPSSLLNLIGFQARPARFNHTRADEEAIAPARELHRKDRRFRRWLRRIVAAVVIATLIVMAIVFTRP